jgi:hypothetical protein
MSEQNNNTAFVRRFGDYLNNEPLASMDEFFATSYTRRVFNGLKLRNATKPYIEVRSSL